MCNYIQSAKHENASTKGSGFHTITADCVYGTADYWKHQYLHCKDLESTNFNLGANLLEETAACVLGGFGLRAEHGLMAFDAIRSADLLTMGQVTPASKFLYVLQRPFSDSGARYRFPNQKAKRLENVTVAFARHEPSATDPQLLRRWLLEIEGIGPKTASWIVRNHTGSGNVAIIDVHLQRAGVRAGFFMPEWSLPRDYGLFERAFLSFCDELGADGSRLDALIWEQERTYAYMRRF